MSPDITASVRARLLNQAHRSGEEFERTLVRFAAERFLYRLGASTARERCLLKGASLLAVWLPDPYRVTRDIDVLAFGAVDDAAVRALVTEICAVPCPEDGLEFDLDNLTLDVIRADEEYAGQRARFCALLGQARIRIQVDIGVGDAVAVEPEAVSYPTLLPTLPAPRLLGYPREQAVAEKFEAMVKLGTRNSRMKDFHDVWALSGAFPFDGGRLQRSVAACFQRRGTPWNSEVPEVLTRAFYSDAGLQRRWSSYLAAGAVLVPPPAQFETIGARIIEFFGPLRERILSGERQASAWTPGGPWG